MSMTVWDWFEQRSFHHGDFSALADQGAAIHPAVTLILPAREVAGTIGPILDTVASLNERTGLVDQILVIDADSADGTADVARAHGAEVYSENELLPEYGPEFAKAAYRRPFSSEGRYLADGGGRVTELTAKPLLNFFFPELTGFVQPLAGEFAASRDLLLRIPFLTGYGVEITILIDVLRDAGLPAIAQVNLGSRQNRHQPLWDLTRMSSAVLRALARRVPALENAAPAPGLWGLPGLAGPQAYLHAVATPDGLRLDEHLSELPERPPMGRILAELPAYQAGM